MPAYFIPARSSRHRTACFALYRALLRQVPQISLPDEIATGWGKTNPIKHFIRTGFRRNKSDTSARLVTTALHNGYRYLNLLSAAARSTSSPEHASILAFLEGRLANYKKNLATHPPPAPPPSTAPRPDTVPLLTRLPGPDPVYVPTERPRPLAELSGGVRKVPRLSQTNGIAFLRLRKPQSPVLSRVLRDKVNRRQARMTLAQQLLEEGILEAEEEDVWDQEVSALAAREGRMLQGDGGGASFRDSVQVGWEYLRAALTEEKDDMIARGKAMFEIVEREKELAEKEKLARKQARLRGREASSATQAGRLKQDG